MKAFVSSLCIVILLGTVSWGVFAQEKTLQYYNSHENELLPDARASFQKGDYDRTTELCRWHYIIFGDNLTVNLLREKSDRCAQLSREMNDLKASGNVKDAKQKANDILSINPEDTAAKEVLAIEDPLPSNQDTVVVESPVIADDTVVSAPIKGQVQEVVDEPKQEPIQQLSNESFTPSVTKSKKSRTYEPHTRFVLKAGASILNLKQFAQTVAPEGSFGLYDIGGLPIGFEAGFYVCSGLCDHAASLRGIEASFVFRESKVFYPKAGIGFFSCKSLEQSDSVTNGISFVAGLTFVVGGHFCLEIGAKYFPQIEIMGSTTVSTSSVSYEFPAPKEVFSGGIVPMVSIGWAF